MYLYNKTICNHCMWLTQLEWSTWILDWKQKVLHLCDILAVEAIVTLSVSVSITANLFNSSLLTLLFTIEIFYNAMLQNKLNIIANFNCEQQRLYA